MPMMYTFTQYCLLAAFGGPILTSMIYGDKSSGGKQMLWALGVLTFCFSVYAMSKH